MLMRKYKLPFRVGHHFASEVVDYAKAKDIKPLALPLRRGAAHLCRDREGLGASRRRCR